jgi:outer membrane protein assembly factor BamC
MKWYHGPRQAGRGRALAFVSILLAVAGCSSVDVSDKIDYRTVAPQKPLDVPPDLSPLPRDDRFQVPTGGAARSTPPGLTPLATTAPVVAPPVQAARIERAGAQSWLSVDASPEQAYVQVKALFESVGLKLEREDPALGIVETVWAENRAKLPQDIIRRTLGRLLDALYSTNELDKYRARIERTPKNTAEIFISHRGMVEVYTSSQQERTVWQVRPSEPALEAEMLHRLQLRFQEPASGAAAAAPQAVATPPAPQNARLIRGAGESDTRVQIDEPFDRAWRRVGLALDRGGFTVEDRDRTRGLYFVRYLDPEYEAKQREQQGVLSRIFGREAKIDAQQFRIQVASAASGTEVKVLDRDGKPEAGATGTKILAQITEQLR